MARVELSNFRSYSALNLDISPALNVLFGVNAQGKTNLLEAVYLISSTRLLRGSKDAEAVREGAERARVSLELEGSGTELAVVLEPGRRKQAYVNSASLPRAADLIGRLPSVCVSSFDMEVIRGSPDERRLFMDLELSQLSPKYLNHLAHYKRALEHRNALLRRAQDYPVSSGEYEPWEAALSEHGSEIRRTRQALVEELAPKSAELQANLGSGEQLRLSYEPKDSALSGEEALKLLEASRERDIPRGGTSTGPHRDDLASSIDGRDARHFGSQGQQRSALLSLKLAAFLRQAEHLRHPPLLLMDDILSDLDEGRRARLVEWVLDHAGQAILTCTEPEAAGSRLLESAALFRVVAGAVRRE